MEQTLVLDASWQPIDKVDWQRAVTLLWEDKVEVLASYEDRVLHSASWDIQMPAVIRFFNKITRRKPGIKFSRDNLLVRDGFRCQYCGGNVTRETATYDHVIPRAQGGQTNFENILIACIKCNQKKGARTPAQAKMTALSKPVRPKNLEEHLHIAVQWRPSYPEEWRAFFRDAIATHQYWNAELESDDIG